MIVGCVTMTQTKTIAQEDTQENGSHSVTKISDQTGIIKSSPNASANAKVGTFLYEKYKFQNLTQSDEIKIENFSIFVKYLLTHLNSQDTTNAKLLKFLKTAHFSDNLTGSIPKMLYKILFYNQNGEISDRGLKMSFYELSFEVCKYFKMTVASDSNSSTITGATGQSSSSNSSNSTMMINTINSLNSNNKNIENISFEDFKRILLIVPEKSFYIFGHEFIKNINKIYSTPIILYNIMQASLFFEDFKKIQTVLFNILKPYLLSWVNKLDLLNNRNGKGARKIYETYRAVLDVVPL